MKRLIASILSVVTLTAALPLTSVFAANGYWNESEDGWRYLETDTQMVVNRFAHIDGHWYNFDENGIMQVGWYNLPESDVWYYFKSNGQAVINNWIKVDGKWYFFDEAGYMVTGWKMINETWYYFYDSGSLKTGWLKRDGNWYYLTGDGVMKYGWMFDGGKWYYFREDGSMAVDCTITDKGIEYTFDYNGVWWVSGTVDSEDGGQESVSPESPENSTDLDAEDSEPEPTVDAAEQLVNAMIQSVSASCKKRPVATEAIPEGYLQSTLCLDRELIAESYGLKARKGTNYYLVIEAKEGKMEDLLIQINIARRTLVSKKKGTATKVWSQGNYLALIVMDNSCTDRDTDLEIAAAAFDAKAKELLGISMESETSSDVSETDSSTVSKDTSNET